jgi:Undecaprenyl-phosphate galactose phosphotransferase WbaP
MLALALPLFLILGPLARVVASWLPIRSGSKIPFYFVGNRDDVFQIYQHMCLFGHDVMEPAGRFVYELSDVDLINFEKSIDTDDEFERIFERKAEFKGTTEDILDAALRDDVYWLLVVRGGAPSAKQDISVQRIYFPQVIEMSSSDLSGLARGQIMNFGAATGIRVEECLLLPSSRFLKRALDIAVAFSTLVLLMPLLLLICIAIKLTSWGPIFFSQERIGLNGERFRAWKFRSMVCNATAELEKYFEKHPEMRLEWNQTRKLRNDPRVTRIGHFIRRSSLDELPQLWNVLVGQMSLVGPRPIQAAEIARYGSTFNDYIRVVPGITGLWQISGRSNTTYAERLVLDEFYVRNWSVWFDIYILYRTLKTVAMCEGAC